MPSRDARRWSEPVCDAGCGADHPADDHDRVVEGRAAKGAIAFVDSTHDSHLVRPCGVLQWLEIVGREVNHFGQQPCIKFLGNLVLIWGTSATPMLGSQERTLPGT